MSKFVSNLRKEISRRGVFGTVMAWHRGYLRPGVEATFVGSDERGNRYYEAKEMPFGQDRWVEYSTSDDWGHNYDASQVPPAWHAWLHHVHDQPVPHQAVYSKPHKENKTGTQEAYHPHNYTFGPRVKSMTDPNCEEWDPSLPSPWKEPPSLK